MLKAMLGCEFLSESVWIRVGVDGDQKLLVPDHQFHVEALLFIDVLTVYLRETEILVGVFHNWRLRS